MVFYRVTTPPTDRQEAFPRDADIWDCKVPFSASQATTCLRLRLKYQFFSVAPKLWTFRVLHQLPCEPRDTSSWLYILPARIAVESGCLDCPSPRLGGVWRTANKDHDGFAICMSRFKLLIHSGSGSSVMFSFFSSSWSRIAFFVDVVYHAFFPNTRPLHFLTMISIHPQTHLWKRIGMGIITFCSATRVHSLARIYFSLLICGLLHC